MINLARRLLRGAVTFKALSLSAISGDSVGAVSDTGVGAAVDASGNLLMTGNSSWLAKFSNSGTLEWQRNQNMVAETGPAVDASGNVYMLGYINATPDLLHLLKYNSSGTLQWQRKLTTTVDGRNSSLVVNASGDCFVYLGLSGSPLYCGIAKYNSSGTLQWQRKLSSAQQVYPGEMTASHDGGVIVVGSAGTASFGFVAKYNSAGSIQWQNSHNWGVTGVWSNVAVDSTTGDIYTCGQHIIGTGALAIAKLNSSGTLQWVRRLAANTSTSTHAMAVEAATGNLFIFMPHTAVLTCFNASGTVQWERKITGETGALATNSNARNNMKVVDGRVWLALTLNHSTSGLSNAAVLCGFPSSGGSAATLGYITVAVPTAAAYTTPINPAVAAGTLTDAAGTLTDAAGTVTDAAGTLTFTTYTG